MAFQLTGTNHQGSTLLALAGGTATAINYSPSGATRARSGALASLPGFNGERADPFSAVTHLGNGYRAYSPALQRFTCPDSESPFGVGGINPYAYCEGDPVNLIDPSGHGPVTWLIRKAVTIGIRLGLRSAAAESMSASLAALSGVETGLEVAATAATGIASKETEKTNPQASQRLKWASVGMGAVMGVYGAGKAGARLHKAIGIPESRLDPNKWQKMYYKVLASDMSEKYGDIVEEGFISNFSDTGEPALVFHGTRSHGIVIGTEVRRKREAPLRGVRYEDYENKMQLVDPEGLVAYLKTQGIDFSDPIYNGKSIHLLCCYGKRYAQGLANATQRNVVAYSSQPISIDIKLRHMSGRKYDVYAEYHINHPLHGRVHIAVPETFRPFRQRAQVTHL